MGSGCGISLSLGMRGEVKADMQNTCFLMGYIRFMFILIRTFTRGRYSLIVSDCYVVRRAAGCGIRDKVMGDCLGV